MIQIIHLNELYCFYGKKALSMENIIISYVKKFSLKVTILTKI